MAPLLSASYEVRVREPGQRLVRTPARDVHLYGRGDPAVEEYLLLRDADVHSDRAELRGGREETFGAWPARARLVP